MHVDIEHATAEQLTYYIMIIQFLMHAPLRAVHGFVVMLVVTTDILNHFAK